MTDDDHGVRGGQGRDGGELVGAVCALAVFFVLTVGPTLVVLVLRWLGVVR